VILIAAKGRRFRFTSLRDHLGSVGQVHHYTRLKPGGRYGTGFAAEIENRFFSGVVRIQTERGHRVEWLQPGHGPIFNASERSC
jgi:hypothetical protein